MTSNVTVSHGVTLTVEAGVVVQASGTGLTIHGALRAIGTPSQPITFTTASATPAPGQWPGISFEADSDDARSLLEYVSVGYAGSGMSVCNGQKSANADIAVCNAAPAIRHTTVHHSFVDGIWLSGAGHIAAMPQLDANTFTANGGSAVHLPFTNGGGVLPTGAGNTATGNTGFNGLAIDGTLAYSTTLAPTLGLPIGLALGDLTVNQGAELSVAPGTTVVAQSYGLTVHGALRAIGTPGQPITFTTASATPAPGQWPGISFEADSDDAQSLLEYVSVGYAGGDLYSHECQVSLNSGITICDAAPTIRNSTVHGSDGDGIWISGIGQITSAPQLDANTFTANRGSAVHLLYSNGGGVLPVGAGNTASGNTGFNGLAIEGTLAYSTTLAPALGLPLGVMRPLTINQGAELTVAPGMTVLFGQGGNYAGLLVHGALRAAGTPTQPITFTAAITTPTPILWSGIMFDSDSDDARNLMEHVVVSYAGYYLYSSGCKRYFGAAIFACDSAPTIRYTTVHHGGGFGALNASLTLSHNTFGPGNRLGVYGKASVLRVEDSVVRENETGVWVEGGALTIEGSTIQDSEYSGVVIKSGAVVIDNSIIRAFGTGVRVEDGNFTVRNSAIQDNGVGVELWEGDATITNCSIIGNRDSGVKNLSGNHVVTAKFNWWGRASDHINSRRIQAAREIPSVTASSMTRGS